MILSTDGRAWATVEPGAAVVALEAGSVELHVEKRAAGDGRRFDVRAGGYRFTVLGTKFEVSRRADGRVRLAVTEGRVAVFRAEHRLAVVAAGGAWSSGAAEAASGTDPALEAPPPRERADEGTPRSPLAKPESPAASAPGALASPPVTGGGGPPVAAVVPAGDSGPSALGTAPRMVPPPFDPPPLPAAPDLQPGALRRDPPLSPPAGGTVPESSCVASARGDVRRLLACYLEQARGSGLPAEVALYESARLRQDSLADLPGALDLLREHRSRFPSGTLTFEVRLSMAELLPRLGHHREALAEIDWLLDAQGAVHRRGELLLLRGHVLREGFSDWAGAERAYGRAVEARAAARTTDAAAFWQAVCLEALGRKDEARRAYDHYLTRPHSALREQAEARLRALDREHSPGGKARSR